MFTGKCFNNFALPMCKFFRFHVICRWCGPFRRFIRSKWDKKEAFTFQKSFSEARKVITTSKAILSWLLMRQEGKMHLFFCNQDPYHNSDIINHLKAYVAHFSKFNWIISSITNYFLWQFSHSLYIFLIEQYILAFSYIIHLTMYKKRSDK